MQRSENVYQTTVQATKNVWHVYFVCACVCFHVTGINRLLILYISLYICDFLNFIKIKYLIQLS